MPLMRVLMSEWNWNWYEIGKNSYMMNYSLSICLIVFAFIITVVSCSPKPPVKPPPAPPKPTSANVAPALENQVLDLVNKYRESKKLPPLVANMAIEYEARRHSMDM